MFPLNEGQIFLGAPIVRRGVHDPLPRHGKLAEEVEKAAEVVVLRRGCEDPVELQVRRDAEVLALDDPLQRVVEFPSGPLRRDG